MRLDLDESLGANRLCRVLAKLDGFGFLENKNGQALQTIASQTDGYILSVNKAEHVEHLVSEYSIQPVKIQGDQLSVSVWVVSADVVQRIFTLRGK